MINYIKQFTRPRSEWFPYQHLLLLAGVIYAFTLPVAAGWWVAAFAMWFLEKGTPLNAMNFANTMASKVVSKQGVTIP